MIVPPPPVNDVFADSTPWVSLSVTVKISPAVAPLSVRLTPVIAVAWPTRRLRPRHSNHRRRVPSHRSSACALLPKLSVTFTVMLSGPAAPLVSMSDARSLFNVVSEETP